MKKLALASALGVSALVSAFSAQAATAGGSPAGDFNVNINLTSVCLLVKPTDINFDYASFQTSAQAPTSGGVFGLICTKNLVYTFALDALTTIDNAVDLSYTLSLPTAVKGTGAAQSYTIGGSISAGQAGNCATTTCTNSAATNKTRTLTVTY